MRKVVGALSEENSVVNCYEDNLKEYFPECNGLVDKTLDTTLLKMMEEVGELSRAYSKFGGLNGEDVFLSKEDCRDEIIKELLDVMQVSASFLYILINKYPELDIEHNLKMHRDKLIKKGYVK